MLSSFYSNVISHVIKIIIYCFVIEDDNYHYYSRASFFIVQVKTKVSMMANDLRSFYTMLLLNPGIVLLKACDFDPSFGRVGVQQNYTHSFT